MSCRAQTRLPQERRSQTRNNTLVHDHAQPEHPENDHTVSSIQFAPNKVNLVIGVFHPLFVHLDKTQTEKDVALGHRDGRLVGILRLLQRDS